MTLIVMDFDPLTGLSGESFGIYCLRLGQNVANEFASQNKSNGKDIYNGAFTSEFCWFPSIP